MADAFFTKSERKSNVDHEALCRMMAYERNLLVSFLSPDKDQPKDRRLLIEAADVTIWINTQLNQ